MPSFRLDTPVAFIIFNRPDTASRVFAQIAKARPPRLLVVGDGPRGGHPDESARVAASRAIIEQVDWPCEVLTNYSETNLGCKVRVSGGLDWVFQQAGEAIILEDDCLPDPTFFRFCQEMLQRYRHDQRVGVITGCNFQRGHRLGPESYYFSKYTHIWGWASWRNRWQNYYDVRMAHWPHVRDAEKTEDLVCGDRNEAHHWRSIFDRVYHGKIDTWDYQWTFANWLAGRLTVTPAVNLISNIGFGGYATHTHALKDPLANLPTSPLQFPLVHPTIYLRNIRADRVNDRYCFRPPLWKRMFVRPFWKRVCIFINKLFQIAPR